MADADVPAWVRAAAEMPVAFAQVREDSLLGLWVLDRLGGDALRGIAIASGGCTVAALAALGRLAHLHLVDVNAAQMALCRLKLQLLQTETPNRRTALLGHVAGDALGPTALASEVGPDHLGRYELVFAELRSEMRSHTDELFELLMLDDAAERVRRGAPTTRLGMALDLALDRVMALPNLVRLFGSDATRNSREPFSRHFARRIRHALAALPTRNNPYLWQMLLGRFPPGVRYHWLDAPAPGRMPHVTESIGTMDAALGDFRDSFDFVHLSNILDWLALDQARQTLELACRALRPHGYVLIRQLNSTLDIPSLGRQFEWHNEEARALHARDRSFFYTALHLGSKR